MTAGNNARRGSPQNREAPRPLAYHGPVSGSILWRAVLAQAVAVGVLFAVLLALPLPSALFREQGAWIGPLSWLGCALVSGAVLRLGGGRTVAAAVVSGCAAVAASVVIGHSSGLVAGVLVFGLACATRLGHPSGASPSRDVPA